ncbi:MAG TPA: arabinofuranosidase catalytic domain-containing protein, partial [Puia sp.]|nr:arabinofuranosidase catalytic domain-containing protein [Puia sp.]
MKAALPLFFCFFLMLPATLWAGNSLDKVGNPTATPLVAFSLRQLSSAYTGKAIQVRRSSDNASQDIGFTATGNLDTAALKTFVGSGNGYVSIWYDQSGNGYNATQTTVANQPVIMSGGVINRDNGQPSVYTSATGFLTYGPVSQLSGTTQVTRMEVCRSRDANNLAITEGLGTYQLDLQFFPTKIWVQFETGNIVANAAVSNPTTLMSINSVRNSGASQLYVNTALLGSATATIMTFSAPVTGYIGVRFDYLSSNTGIPGAFSETILFNSVLSDADRQAMNYNENWYYSLGFDPCSSTAASLSANGTTSRALYACTQDGPYAYYYDPAHPLKLLFGIAKDPGSSGANPSFVVDSINLTTTSDP